MNKSALDQLSTITSPRPSISIAPREAKCSIRRFNCAGHWLLTQRTATCSGSLTTLLPHSGHIVGMRNFFSLPVRKSVRTLDNRGNDFTGFLEETVSPMRMSLRSISSSLCKVARETRLPLTVTGSSAATGVSTPGSSHLNQNVEQLRFDAFRCVFVSDGPARRFRGEAERSRVAQRSQLSRPRRRFDNRSRDELIELANGFQNFLDRIRRSTNVRWRQAQFFQQWKKFGVFFQIPRLRPRRFHNRINPERTLRGDCRIELLQRTGCGIARIGEKRQALLPRARRLVSRSHACP